MKRLLPLVLLLVTGCASVHTHKEADVLARPAASCLNIPVFVTFGPNLVGYESIFTTTLIDMNIPLGAKIACNFIASDGDVILLEGTMLSKDPLFLLVNTRQGLMPLEAKRKEVEFCLITETEMK